jgi:Ser/Thr protein kinase RdoA (MazF antagonist)
LENPPYDVLLGRPFEVFTNSALKNAENGEVLLTITDPNTKRQVVMPTYERGESPEDLQKKQVQSF